jgi:hypothetical protein
MRPADADMTDNRNLIYISQPYGGKPEYLYQLITEEAAFRDMVQGIKKEGSRQLAGQTLSYRDHNQP